MSEEPLIREEELQQEVQDIINSDLEDARKKIRNANKSSSNNTNNPGKNLDTKHR
jgi:hypothetical protein